MQKNDKSEVIINIKSKDDIIEELQAENEKLKAEIQFLDKRIIDLKRG